MPHPAFFTGRETGMLRPAIPQSSKDAGSATASLRILVVEDDGMVALHLEELLQDFGYAVIGVATTATQAIAMARETSPDAILMDVRLRGERDGVTASLAIRAERPVPVIFATGSSDPVTLGRIRDTDPAGLLVKPIRPEHLRDTLASVLGN